MSSEDYVAIPREIAMQALQALEEGREYQGEVLEVVAGLREYMKPLLIVDKQPAVNHESWCAAINNECDCGASS